MALKLTQSVIEGWLTLVSGRFNTREIWEEVGVVSQEGKAHLRVILLRLEQEGKIISLGGGYYRKVDDRLEVMDWQGADPGKTIELKFPFGIEQFVKLYPKSIVIVTGDKNVGKTAFLYNFIVMNMDSFVIDLFNSETGKEQMRERFDYFDIPSPAPFNTYERYDNFADVINPDRISVIDYLDLNSEVYLVGEEIDRIFRKLKNGVAIIGLQKPPPIVTYIKGVKKVVSRDLAYGGGFSAKRAVLYITMGNNRLKLVYVKTPRNKSINPDNKQWSFKFDETGTHFDDIQPYYEGMEE